MSIVKVFWIFSRPFTLVPPMVGIFSGSLIGYGASRVPFPGGRVALAVLAAAVLNAASNGLNQICDLENDRINKPHRPLPSGALTPNRAWIFVIATYATALALVVPVNRQTLAIYAAATVATILYSAPPVRLKRHPVGSNFIIALVRDNLLFNDLVGLCDQRCRAISIGMIERVCDLAQAVERGFDALVIEAQRGTFCCGHLAYVACGPG